MDGENIRQATMTPIKILIVMTLIVIILLALSLLAVVPEQNFGTIGIVVSALLFVLYRFIR